MTSFYWTTDVNEAKREQQTLAELVKIKNSTFSLENFKSGLAIGTAYEENTKTAFATSVRFDQRGKIVSAVNSANTEVDFPYTPGMLAFRVGPAICLILENFPENVDLLLFDGQGIAHSIGFGLASHIGVLFNKPSIGVTKKALFGNYSTPTKSIRFTELRHPRSNCTIGYCIASGNNYEPFFMSPGHQITLAESLAVIKMISGNGYLPNPIRIAHAQANRLAKKFWDSVKKDKGYSF